MECPKCGNIGGVTRIPGQTPTYECSICSHVWVEKRK